MSRKVLYFVLPFLILVLFLLSCDRLPGVGWQGKKRDKLRTELRKMCDDLTPPTEFKKDNALASEMLKPGRGAYGYRYRGAIGCDLVREHYSNILLPQHWRLETENGWSVITNETSTDLSYYKDKHRISISCLRTNSPYSVKEFTLSCEWSNTGY